MRFLTVADRELRAAARRSGTFRARWITGAVFFLLLIWIAVVSGWAVNRAVAPEIFQVFSFTTFFYCLVVVSAQTADCLSAERREGTLGLLFLTNLNSAEIVAGKVCSHALAAVYALFAIFPMLGLTLLLGGISLDWFARTVLALLSAIFYAVTAGLLASSLCQKQARAVALAIGLALGVAAGVMGLGALVHTFFGPRSWLLLVTVFSPLFTLVAAEKSPLPGPSHYWLSVAAVAGVSWTWIALATWRLSRTWRDRPQAAPAWGLPELWRRWRGRGATGRTALRRRLLALNPFLWLDSRRQISTPGFMLVTILAVGTSVLVLVPLLASTNAGWSGPLAPFTLIWFFTGLGLHALTLYYAGMVASQRVAEDRQSGALELVLCAPVSERVLARGLWLAYARRMLFPTAAATLAHLFFIWLGATLLVLVAPAELPTGLSTAQFVWNAWLDQWSLGRRVDWSFAIVLRILLLALAQFALLWITLGWLGRWLGLRLKHPGFAPIVALALALAPPTVLFFILCVVADEWGWLRRPDRVTVPVMVWVAFGLGVGHCALLSAWAARHLRRDFRTVVSGEFRPKTLRQWLRPGWRGVWGWMLRLAVTCGALGLAVLLFYGWQNWRSRVAWAEFQNELMRKGESLRLAPLLPPPVPDTENFAKSPAFQRWQAAPADSAEAGLVRGSYPSSGTPPNWTTQNFSSLEDQAKWLLPQPDAPKATNRAGHAAAIAAGLLPQEAALRDLAAAARLPCFQPPIRRNYMAVFGAADETAFALRPLHARFLARASARLALDDAAGAGEDLLTCLHLARLARQLPRANSTRRTQRMLLDALQPLWEGLAEHRWREAQLAAIQDALAGFNLLADHTNALRRVVHAYIEVWRTIPDSPNPTVAVPVDGGGTERVPDTQWLPRAWWFDRCIELHAAGERALARVDVAGGRITSPGYNRDLEGLPLGSAAVGLLEETPWWGPGRPAVSFTQTSLNQAILACALERHRLAQGAYPYSLDALVPKLLPALPKDTVSGQPILYERLDDAHFILRGVGPNGRSDARIRAGDDWLWAFPADADTAPE